MALTDAQKVTLGNHIRANEDQSIIDAIAANDLLTIRLYYNAMPSPDFWVFVTSVAIDEVRRSLDWGEMEDAVKMTEQRWKMFDTLFSNGTYNPEEENNREALIRIFPGNAYPEEERMPNCRAAVLEDATTKANRVEQVLSIPGTGPAGGDGSQQSMSAVRGFYGEVGNRDIEDALAATA